MTASASNLSRRVVPGSDAIGEPARSARPSPLDNRNRRHAHGLARVARWNGQNSGTSKDRVLWIDLNTKDVNAPGVVVPVKRLGVTRE